MTAMPDILAFPLKPSKAALWFLGQAGYIIRSCGVTIAVDPYLSDSVGRAAPDFKRLYPVPLRPDELHVDFFVVTHDHLDHLDPETVAAYARKDATAFVAPSLAAAKLVDLGVPQRNLTRVDRSVVKDFPAVRITGVHAMPTSPDVGDTTGYLFEFPNGRSVYHTSDTAFSESLLAVAPHAEVLLVCINGKWGNLDVNQAVALAAAVKPRFAIPNHYDMMALNSADPAEFKIAMSTVCPGVHVMILDILRPFVW